MPKAKAPPFACGYSQLSLGWWPGSLIVRLVICCLTASGTTSGGVGDPEVTLVVGSQFVDDETVCAANGAAQKSPKGAS
jgi:hypothetical protein